MFYLFCMEPRWENPWVEHFIQVIRLFLYPWHNLHVNATTPFAADRARNPFIKTHQRDRRVKRTRSSFSEPNTRCTFLYVCRLLRLTCKSHMTSPSRQACNRCSSKSAQAGRTRGEETVAASDLYFLGMGDADGADGVHGVDARGERARGAREKETREKETREKETREKAAGSAAPRRVRTAPPRRHWL